MTEPKFKAGDDVRHQSGEKFTVWAIGGGGNDQFFYKDRYSGTSFFPEGALELYEEPKKKKLYAYRDNILESIEFSEKENPRWGSHKNRAPEYDIEYPESKVDKSRHE